jgi:hypothetical protein
MHKNSVHGVGLTPYSSTEETLYTSKDSIAYHVIIRIPGKYLVTALCAFNTGSGSGSRKAALLEDSASYPATVEVNLPLSRNTGLNRLPGSSQITLQSAIWSMTLPTSIRTAV